MVGRPQSTGRYATRAELEDAVWSDRQNTQRSIAQIARVHGVSQHVASKILDGKPPTPEPEPIQRCGYFSGKTVPPGCKHLLAAVIAALTKSICYGCSTRFGDDSPEARRATRYCINCRDQRAVLAQLLSPRSF